MTSLVWLASGFVAGVWLSRYWPSGNLVPLILAATVLGTYALARTYGIRAVAPTLFALALLAGLGRGGPGLLVPSGNLAQFHGESVTIAGQLVSMPEAAGGRVRTAVAVDALSTRTGLTDASGTVLVWLEEAPTPVPGRDFPFLERGDQVAFKGRLEAPERIGVFDYPEHLASQDIGSVLNGEIVSFAASPDGSPWGARADGLRRSLARAIDRALPQPAAAVTQALSLGLRGSLPAQTRQQFRDSGTTHILAISGLHVGMMLALALGASAAVLGRRRQIYLLAPLGTMWVYVLLAGAPPSALRAAIMGTAVLLAYASGRAPAPFTALGLASAVMLAWDPAFAWHRSFQLSFGAMAGVLLIGLPLWNAVRGWLGQHVAQGAVGTIVRWSAAGTLASLGAIVGSLPLVAFNFGVIPIFGIPATLLIMPVVPIIIVGGLLAGLLGAVWAPLAWLVAWAPALSAWYAAGVARAFASLPGATVDVGPVAPWLTWAYYALLVAVLAYVRRNRWWPSTRLAAARAWAGPARARLAVAALVAAVSVAAVPWALAGARADDLLSVRFLDVGQGDAALVHAPSGATVLIDGGRDPRVTLPLVDGPLSGGRIDLAVFSHVHVDHIEGLMGLARRGSVALALVPPEVPGDDGAWRAELTHLGVPLVEAVRGARVSLGDGAWLEVLHPPRPRVTGTSSDIDNNSIVLRLVHGDASVLFTGDLRWEGELALLDVGAELGADILKVGHHGSTTSTTTEFLDAVGPSLAMIGAGVDNAYGHPAQEVLDRLAAAVGDAVLTTADRGSITLVTDGISWWVETER